MPRSVLLLVLFVCSCSAQGAPADDAKVGKLPHLEFSAKTKQVRVECEMLACNAPLEFFCCVKGTNDYEAMIRSEVKPSDLHAALLAMGLQPGQPVRYSESTQKWTPPQGPPLQITMQFDRDGKTVSVPAWRWMRDTKTKKTAPPFTWVFAGSRVLPDGKYAADITGYLVSIVNFDLTVIDIPQIASSSNETLEWERNPDVTPKAGAKVCMVMEPVGNSPAPDPASTPATQPTTPKADATPIAIPANAEQATASVEADVKAAQDNVKELKDQWEQQVGPRREALRVAAETHYRVIQELRARQQKLIDAADRVQRTIDELEKSYQDLTVPRPQTK
ncbi:MAG TPA: YdjY domain-containing protein [Tepidisphaeraceae bacterium]|jgi:hypothetical protein